VYETFLQPLVMQYQPNIEARLQYLRANAGDILVFYLKNFTERGYDLFLRVLDYVRSQASRGSRTRVHTNLAICSYLLHQRLVQVL
jgi:receptor expression-enhancing protein 1/2/3/4